MSDAKNIIETATLLNRDYLFSEHLKEEDHKMIASHEEYKDKLEAELTASRKLCREYKEVAGELKTIADNYFKEGSWYPCEGDYEKWLENARHNDKADAKLAELNQITL